MLDQELSRLLLSLVLLLFFALAIGHAFSSLGLPRVVGEICAGLVLGPSLLGYFAPPIFSWIFAGFSEQGKMLSVFYWLGLILLMFTAGFKISTKFSSADRFLFASLILGGMGLPFLFGFFASPLLPNSMLANPVALALVIATASAVTSIPVITRIFIDLDMLSSRFAQVVLSAAAAQDLILWIALSTAITIQQGQLGDSISFTEVAPVVGGTVIFSVATLLLFPAILRFAGRAVATKSPDAALFGYTLLVCLVLVSIASLLRVNIVFGALLAGIVIGQLPGTKLEHVKQSITNLAVWFFVPIYFSLVGLQMNLPGNFNPTLIFGFLLTSSLVKIASVAFFSKLARIPWDKAFDFGVTMNARGGPGIVLASLAHAAQIIDEAFFVALVLASILTSLATGAWLKSRRGSIMGT